MSKKYCQSDCQVPHPKDNMEGCRCRTQGRTQSSPGRAGPELWTDPGGHTALSDAGTRCDRDPPRSGCSPWHLPQEGTQSSMNYAAQLIKVMEQEREERAFSSSICLPASNSEALLPSWGHITPLSARQRASRSLKSQEKHGTSRSPLYPMVSKVKHAYI